MWGNRGFPQLKLWVLFPILCLILSNTAFGFLTAADCWAVVFVETSSELLKSPSWIAMILFFLPIALLCTCQHWTVFLPPISRDPPPTFCSQLQIWISLVISWSAILVISLTPSIADSGLNSTDLSQILQETLLVKPCFFLDMKFLSLHPQRIHCLKLSGHLHLLAFNPLF